MSEEQLIRHCAPTLAGIKTANLFTCPYRNRSDVLDFLRQLNLKLHAKGLRALPLRFSSKNVLVYLYRPQMLSKDLANASACQLLHRCGYESSNCDTCVAKLAQKLRQQDDFPHEIGLFLGYPPEDVSGFMDLGPECCKYSGCWRVYGDVESAIKKFDLYKKCSRIYWQQWEKGTDMDRLVVAD